MSQNLVTISTLCYLRHQGRTLMMHRIKKDRDIHEGKYNGLGGKFLPGESPQECVVREVREESSLTIHNPSLRGVMTFPKFKGEEDWLVFLFTATEFSGELTGCEEGELEWVPDGKLSELNLWEGDHLFFEWLKQPKFFSAKFIYQQKKLIDHSVVFYD